MASTAAEFAAGAIFGSALLTSGVYSPAVILSQMELKNFHMLEAFMAASACSAIVINMADRTGHAPTKVRTPGALGWFPYDANLLGGGLQGIGMALTGACPGTVLVQMAAGVRSGFMVCAGGLLGGLAYNNLLPLVQRKTAAVGKATTPEQTASKHTLQSKLNISTDNVMLVYEAFCLFAIGMSAAAAPKKPTWLHPVAGGVLIGIAQALTVLLTKRSVGVSTAYADISRYLLRTSPAGSSSPRIITPAVTFAAGVLSGSAILARSGLVADTAIMSGISAVSNLVALLGGAALVLGARMAGGCPSGHGISGMATFSLSSFATVGAMFAGGIVMANLL